MKKTAFILSLYIIFHSNVFGQTSINWDWTSTGKSDSANQAIGICADLSGDSAYVYGEFKDTIKLGTHVIIPYKAARNYYIVKYDNLGNVLWHQRLGFKYNINGSVNDIVSDYAGNVFLTGTFQGELYAGTDTLASKLNTNAFLIKYSPKGTIAWFKIFPSSSNVYWPVVYADYYGNSYIAGNFLGGSIYIGQDTISPPKSIFVAKFDASGNHKWTGSGEMIVGPPYGLSDIWADKQGNCYITGTYGGKADFGNGNVISDTTIDNAFIVEYGFTGLSKWAISGSGFNNGVNITGDNFGNIYSSGWFLDGMISIPNSIAGTTMVSPTGDKSNGDVYVSKISAQNGAVDWIKTLGSKGWEQPVKLSCDANGKLYILCNYGDTIIVGHDTLYAEPNPDYFNLNVLLAQADSNGNYLQVDRIGKAGTIDVTANGSLFFGGSDSAKFQNTIIPKTFIAKKQIGIPTSSDILNSLTPFYMLIYPNPSHGNFNVSVIAEENCNYALEIINSIGEKVFDQGWKGTRRGSKGFTVSNFSPGIYMVIVTSNDKKIVRKIIVQ